MNGFINLLKTPGITSSTAVSIIKRTYNLKKVGHAGTLDPGAAGVLPIMIGKATRLFDYLQDEQKEYIAEFVFGIDTDTLDMQGKVTAEKECNVTEELLMAQLPEFIGTIKQYPPRVSAISINGKKAYELQRSGVDFEVPEKEITVYSIELIRKTASNSFMLKIACSKGTYIRSLCRDIAAKMDTYGYINYLLRTKSSSFDINDSISIEGIKAKPIDEVIITLDKPIEYMHEIVLSEKYIKNVITGTKIPYKGTLKDVFRVYLNEKFVGLGRPEKDSDIQYIKVFKRLIDEKDI
jgi:tRNA pseudouridine55 synthase